MKTALSLSAVGIAIALSSPVSAHPCVPMEQREMMQEEVGVWEGPWWVYDTDGELVRSYRVRKVQMIKDGVFYQRSNYFYPDGKTNQRDFYAVINENCEIEFKGVDFPALDAYEMIVTEVAPTTLVRTTRERKTGIIGTVDHFTIIADERSFTRALFRENGVMGYAGLVTARETKIADAPAEIPFEIPAGAH